MIPSKIAYHKPKSVAEAIQLLNKYEDECKILAGGHSLIPIMRLRLADPENIIDITGIESLQNISDDEQSITIGACVTHGAIAKNNILKEYVPMLAHAAGMIGDLQVRNFGTIGGSIAHADPAADWPAVLLAANASIVVQNESGSREVHVDEFFKGLFMTAAEENEIITAIRIPKTAANKHSTYHKFVQPASRFAIVGCAAAVAMDNGKVANARVAFSGVSATPFRDTGIENALTGNALDPDNIAIATAKAADGASVMSDHYANEKYRRHLAGVYANRALNALA